MTRRLVCAGEVVVDLTLRVPALPARGGDVVASEPTAVAGGAVNVMAAARRQGVPVTYAGLLGTGPMAALARAGLDDLGVEVPLPPRLDRDTATIVTLVEPDGERTFVTTLGAEADLTDADLDTVDVRRDDIVTVSGYGLAYPHNGPCLARWVPALPDTVTVLLDPGPLVAEIPAAVLAPVLARADWVTATVAEARVLVAPTTAAVAGPAVLARALRERVRQVAVLRAGPQGARVATSVQRVHAVPAFDVRAVDLTGAGDAHTGTLVAALAHAPAGSSPGERDVLGWVRRANAAAAIAVTRPGPATAPTTRELDDFLARHDTPAAAPPGR